KRTRDLRRLITIQSCVEEALALAEINGVHAMHDLTEGGLTASLNEMAEASKLGFKIKFEKIPICPEAQKLKEVFGLSNRQLLSMSSTGAVLVAVDPQVKDEVEKLLMKYKLKAHCIGVFTEDKSRTITVGGRVKRFPEKAEDPYEEFFISMP
ncbi:MAG: AIR synthase-related protein, partial [Candidatus Bathyarchaeia archaeon]